MECRQVLAGTITGRLWIDTDYDGQQDAAETETASATVSLVQFSNVVAQSTTVNGVYTFNNVATNGGFYTIRFDLPAGYTLGPSDTGDDATDNDYDVLSTAGATGADVDFVNVADNQTVDLDAGLVRGAAITAFAWNDVDGDGIQDPGAPESNGLAGVSVTLVSTAYAQTAVTTGADGKATFSNVRPGNFRLGFTHSTFVRTLQNQGADDTLDSDADPGTGNTHLFLLAPNTSRTDVDAGFRDPAVVTGNITGRAWLDNGDGIRQVGETSLTGTHVLSLYRSTDGTVGNADDQFVTSAATDVNQNYQFTNLVAGSYYVKTVVPANHNVTLQNQGADDAVDSDFHPTTLNSGMLSVVAGGTVNNVDVGFIPGTGTIGDRVWLDANSNGIQDPTETGLSGAVVKLFNSANSLVGGPLTTTATGAYSFTGLLAGQYYVQVTPPAGYLATLPDQGADDTKDSDLSPSTFKTSIITLAAGQTQLQWDAGFFLGGKVGDRVWLDADGDGRQDNGELGKANIEIRLKIPGPDGNVGTMDDVVVAQTATDANGNYQFAGLADGAYYVEFVAPANYVFTQRDVGDDSGDSDAGPNTGRTARFNIINHSTDLTIDAGLVPAGTVRVTVKPDPNGDGILDPGGLGGFIVWVYDPVNGVVGDDDDLLVRQGTTNTSGQVDITLVRPGIYYARIQLPNSYRFSPPNVGGDESSDSDVTHFCSGYGNTGLIVVNANATTHVTAGLVTLPGAIEGVVWNDANRNLIRDGGLVRGAPPDIVLAIDLSGSTLEPLGGTGIGDVNGDGFADTILDAEILGGMNLLQQLSDSGYGSTARIGAVTFNGVAQVLDMNPAPGLQPFATPNADTDANAAWDVMAALRSIRAGGGANYEAALREVVDEFTVLTTPFGRANVLFLSDGGPTTGGSFTDEVANLTALGANVRAFGLGTAAPLGTLRTIDPAAQSHATTDAFFAALRLNNSTGFPSERGMSGVGVYVDLDNDSVWDNGVEPRVLTRDDDPETPGTDETGSYRFGGLAPGNYRVREQIPAGYDQTTPGAPGMVRSVAVTAGKTTLGVDFGNAVVNGGAIAIPASGISLSPASSGVILTNYLLQRANGFAAAVVTMPAGVYTVEVRAAGIASQNITPEIQVTVAGIQVGHVIRVAQNGGAFQNYNLGEIEFQGGSTKIASQFLNADGTRKLYIQQFVLRRVADLPANRTAIAARDLTLSPPASGVVLTDYLIQKQNGAAKTTPNLAAGVYQVEVIAFGTPSQNITPLMQVTVAGLQVGQLTNVSQNGNAFQAYNLGQIEVEGGQTEIASWFHNADGTRKLYIHSIVLRRVADLPANRTLVLAQNMALSPSTSGAVLGNYLIQKQTGVAVAAPSLSPGVYQVEVAAFGLPSQNVAPQMRVTVAGVQVGQVTNVDLSYNSYRTYVLGTVEVTGNNPSVRVEFLNGDGTRRIYIRSLVLRRLS